MWWLVAGGTLIVAGAALAIRAAGNASAERGGTAGGLILALGLSLAFWGLVGVVIGIVQVAR